MTLTGEALGRHRARFDWIRDGRRIEVKYSSLSLYNKSTWRCHFQHIKFAHLGSRSHDFFDELWIVIYSPRGLHMFKHNSSFGLSSAGRQAPARGNAICAYGPRNELDISISLEAMLAELELGGCQLLAEVIW
eukprot:TRINITY_DN43041_c0_g1_i1.p1 TRINITY_DN43041_c0_g1~~TRINITY_DN43041_c0_g1_i1.p1  ORF type:complete len:143 (-),score=15.15 TRINITY_DN43041_c0_g1_i1:43-441(-)